MDKAIELLRAFQRFQQTAHSQDLGLFGQWLTQEFGSKAAFATDDEEVDVEGPDVMGAYLLGSLTSYLEVWVKMYFQELPIRSLSDFAILKTIEGMGSPSKKEVAQRVVMEHSTCIESIKRLVRQDLLKEETDQADKRLKRVSLSKEGRMLNANLEDRVRNLGKLLLGNLNEQEKTELIPLLSKLRGFHDRLYQQRHETDIRSIFGG